MEFTIIFATNRYRALNARYRFVAKLRRHFWRIRVRRTYEATRRRREGYGAHAQHVVRRQPQTFEHVLVHERNAEHRHERSRALFDVAQKAAEITAVRVVHPLAYISVRIALTFFPSPAYSRAITSETYFSSVFAFIFPNASRRRRPPRSATPIDTDVVHLAEFGAYVIPSAECRPRSDRAPILPKVPP